MSPFAFLALVTPHAQRPLVTVDANRQLTVNTPQGAFQAPSEGLWSIATEWTPTGPGAWVHATPTDIQQVGDHFVCSAKVGLSQGSLLVRDSYSAESGAVKCVRRWQWTGKDTLQRVTLSVRFQTAVRGLTLFPGIAYSGNPSGRATRSCVAHQSEANPHLALFEEHRFPMPFVSVEGERSGAAMHSLPSMPTGANRPDQWWSLGGIPLRDGYEFQIQSGFCASNGQPCVVKANQGRFLPYTDTYLNLKPGTIIEKTFWLQGFTVGRQGHGFAKPLKTCLEIFQPYSLDGLPSLDQIVQAKLRFAMSRWRDLPRAGFEMYPDGVEGTHYVMGWCGQAESMPYVLLALPGLLPPGQAAPIIQRSMDRLALSPFNDRGFFNRFSVEKGTWSEQDFVSQGQALETITRTIELAQNEATLNTKDWKAFAHKALTFHANRILLDDWRPVSTNEAFLVSPLLRGARLFKDKALSLAATKAADHYAQRHRSMAEPYWGGTLDAACEDKEGAWAAFQAFLAMYDHSKEQQYLGHAEHAMDVALTYTMVWDVDLPPGRLNDFAFKSRGWTVVSAQNQHLDVFGVYYTPEIYRMGQLLNRPELKRLAAVMFRSCGQLIDPFGSQGEQIQHTNFAQAGEMDDVSKMRGGYSEGWAVFWITTHFLHAAARFHKLGVRI